jgi:acyl-CoA synthetase (AMP-forming)/AMP-acid ligase II
VTSIPELIDRAATWYGDAVAVVDGDRTLSFRQVGERSSRLANALRSLGTQRFARVALLMTNRLEYVEADFAIAKAGMVRVPINPRLLPEEREHILADSAAEVLIVDAEFAPFVEAARERLPALRSVIAVGGDARAAALYESVLAGGSAESPDMPYPPDAPAYLLYTSGTTGRPKGATATSRSRLAATVNMWAEEIDVEPGDGMVHIGSMSHGSGSKVLAYFARGARNITMRRFDPELFLDLVERERATATFMVPTMIAMLVDAARGRHHDLSSLKTISYGGAPIAPGLLVDALDRFGGVFVQVYGSCEAPHPVMVLGKSAHSVPPGKENRLTSVGREVATVEVRVVGRDGVDVQVGEQGEMWVRGDNVMKGYWGNEAATAAVLTDGWYHTGDVCLRDDDGFYYIVDRVRDMVISGGLNVYPAEVEMALYRHPAVAECAVIGVPDDRWGESVLAFVVLRSGHTATEEEIIDVARRHLAGYKKPRTVQFVAELPKGSTGKILKRELRASFWEGRARSVQ